MLRTSFSQILNSSRDFSTAICGADSELVAQADHIPVHVGALQPAAASIIDAFGDDVHPGDIFLLNDPYFGGSHLPDVTAFAPVFIDGTLAFWAINRAHHSDIGGATYGAYNAAAREIWQEGLRLPPLRFYDKGEIRAGYPAAAEDERSPRARFRRRPDGADRLGQAWRTAPACACR